MPKATSLRRQAREIALQTLYTVEVGRQGPQEALAETLENVELDEKVAEFARTLITATLHSQSEIDPILDRLATGFPVDRQSAVDRNILRLAAAEILFSASDAPPGVAVNEAVELAKKFSTTESGRFVNGVLGALVREVEATQPQPPAGPEETTPDA